MKLNAEIRLIECWLKPEMKLSSYEWINWMNNKVDEWNRLAEKEKIDAGATNLREMNEGRMNDWRI